MAKRISKISCFVLVLLLTVLLTSVWAKGPQATIKRDNFGVPHIYSDTLRGLFFGYGYAVAQDRLYQIEMFRRTYWGRLSEVYGMDLLAFDQSNRRDNLSLAEMKRQIKNLSPEMKIVLDSFAAGINAYIKEALASPESLLPKEFHHFGFDPELWTVEDVAADFLSVMGFFMDISGELANADMLAYLKEQYGPEMGEVLFDDWCWGLDPESPTTIVGDRKPGLRNGDANKKAHLNHPVMQTALKASPGAQRLWAKEQKERSRFAKALPYGHPASYVALISPLKSASRKAMLMGGPQFEFELPSALYEVGLHGAGIDCIGSTLTGYPFIMFGHNRRAAFSSTAGADNIEDIFVEKLNPDNPRQYWFKGKWRNMVVRSETFKISGRTEAEIKEFFYTVHGPVFYIDEENDVAFSKKLSCRDRFLDGLASFYDLMKAETVVEFNKAAMLSDMSINYFFANTDGDIAYYHLGLHPVRSNEVDVRLPTPGTGEFEWRSFIPKNQNPHQANPRNGYFVNWNNQPEPGWGHGDMATTDVWGGWGADSRVTNLIQQVEKKKFLNQADLKDIIKTIAFYDKRAINIKELLIAAVQGINPMPPNASEALRLLSEWDNRNIDENGNGECDHAGSAIFDRWWYKAVAATFADWYPDYLNAAGQSAVDILSNRYLGYTLFLKALKGNSGIDYFNGQKAEILSSALAAALDELAVLFPGKPVADYRLPTPMYGYFPVTVLGFFLYQPITSTLEPLLPFPYVDRGTENHIVTLFRNNILGENITSPGNSGFKGFDGDVSPHFYDQVDMFLDFTYKPMLFTQGQVNPNVKSIKRLEWK